MIPIYPKLFNRCPLCDTLYRKENDKIVCDCDSKALVVCADCGGVVQGVCPAGSPPCDCHVFEPTIALLVPAFLEDMVECMAEGAARPGRRPDGWQSLCWDRETEREYWGKITGHVASAMRAEPEKAAEHLAAAACNAMILWFHLDRG